MVNKWDKDSMVDSWKEKAINWKGKRKRPGAKWQAMRKRRTWQNEKRSTDTLGGAKDRTSRKRTLMAHVPAFQIDSKPGIRCTTGSGLLHA